MNNSKMLDYYQEKTVLLTGAGGFIGSNLLRRLLDLGVRRVIGVDNFISSEKAANWVGLWEMAEEKGVELDLVEADVIEVPGRYLPEDVKNGRAKIDLILHFASPASPPVYQKYPVDTYLVNAVGTHNLLEFIRQNNAGEGGRFLFAGTSEAYGTPLEHPQKEGYWGNVNPNGIRSCYDESKRLGETICGVFWRDLGVDARIIRIFNTYGPRMDLNDGRILPEFIKKWRAGEALAVYGEGSQTRSYCYIDDLVEGILRMAGGEREKLGGETVNLGNPGEYTVLETAKIFNRVVGRDENMIEFKPLPKDDPTRRQPAIEKARELLDGWQPEVGFEEGVKRTLDFYS